MSLPFFFVNDLGNQLITLDEDTSKHMISVLRMKKDEEVLLTDGKGKKARAIIEDDNRKKTRVRVEHMETLAEPVNSVTIAISITKNSSRFEWFLEKATEIGVSGVIPLLCERTEKEKFRFERMQQVMTSALLQSQQCWLPQLYEPLSFSKVINMPFEHKLIAHCLPGQKTSASQFQSSPKSIILIGPEGDFTSAEINQAMQMNFIPVALGDTRLRTETAGIAAAVLLCIQ